MAVRWISAILAASAFALAASAVAQQPLTPVASEPIIVVGSRAEELAATYAGEIAVASPQEDQYARWSEHICPSVAGLPTADAQTLIDHIAVRAHAVGIDTGNAGCQRNLIIIFTQDSDAIARQIVDSRRDLMGYYNSEDTAAGSREALEAFASTPRPVRWWHIAYTVTADGHRLNDTDTGSARTTASGSAASQDMGADAGGLGGGMVSAEMVRSNGTRFHRSTRQDIGFVLIIVDSRRIAGLPSSAVADYVAMAALVQLDPAADMRAFPSILNLFADHAAGQTVATTMTDWDLGYLQGLYAATREAANARQQRSQIARRIVREVGRN